MTGSQFASYVRYLTKTSSTTFTDADLVLVANVVKNDFAKEILKADEDLFGIPQTRDLVASSTSREYSIPSGTLKIKRLEANLTGSKWVRMTPLDLNLYNQTTDEETIVSQFGNEDGRAFYDLFRQAFQLYTGTIDGDAVTPGNQGLKLHAIMIPADITTATLSGNTELSEDPSSVSSQLPIQFHELWARKINIIYKQSKEKPIPLTDFDTAFAADFEQAMASIRNMNSDQELVAQMPDDTHLQ